jgi:hypothetical protein
MRRSIEVFSPRRSGNHFVNAVQATKEPKDEEVTMDAADHSDSVPMTFTGPESAAQMDEARTSPMSEHHAAATAEEDGMTDRSDRSTNPVAVVANRLKPVAIVAENVAGRAVDLSARGLTRLSEYLERRRRLRERHAADDSNIH